MDGSLIAQRSGYDPEAIAAREAEITGKPQRIEPLRAEELSGDAKDLVHRIRAAVGLAPSADIPEYCLTMVKHPEIFRCQMEMGAAIFKGALSPRERELAVLRVGWLMRAPYEWGEHVDISQRYGVTPEEIERVILGAAAPGWSEHDAALLRAVEELLSEQAISDATWATLAKSWNEQQLIELPMMVGQYVATALVQNALRMRLASDNPGLTYR
ncbi:carboxymuconolactone decarboxylase family protein [Phenylobacterium sp. LjRoot225]|uniref:carboxymuconolactone decarboxylase family protein n=1 Tax=Phenylobacterium sp. LjRoot225 TaxID=3342285 RepID=UPI003ECC6993